MRKYIIILLLIICFHPINAQIQMDVVEMTVSKLKKGSHLETVTNGKDTIAISIIESGEYDSPFIQVVIKIKNISNSVTTLYPNESKLYISYFFEGDEFKKSIYFNVKQEDNDTSLKNEIVLQPAQELYLLSSGYIADDTILDLRFDKEKDNTINVMKILPTLKYHYEDYKANLKVMHKDILDVKVRKLPIGSEFIIPKGYNLLDQEY